MGWELWRGASMQDNEMTATLFAAALYLYKNKYTCFCLGEILVVRFRSGNHAF